VLFLDEPTKGMDVLTAETLRSLLREELVRHQGKTVLLTTHDLEEMEALCDRVGILDQGTLRAVGTPAALIAEASASVVYRLELAGPLGADGAAGALVAELAVLPGVRSCQLVTQSPTGLVLDLGLDESPAAEAVLFAALGARGLRVHRYAPKDDGLVGVLKQSLAESE
jgi:ABC-2 type transport system ATP-binding protein